MAAFAPQPVIVGSLAKAPTFDRLIFFAANSEVVSSTPCLDWQPVPTGPNGEARVQLKTFWLSGLSRPAAGLVPALQLA